MTTTPTAELPRPSAGANGQGTLTRTAQAPPAGGGDFEGLLEEDTYDLTLVDIQEALDQPNQFRPGETRDVCIFLFTVDGHEDQGRVAQQTSFSLHPKSKFGPTFEALGHKVPGVGEPIVKAKYVGSKCRGVLTPKESRSGKEYMVISKLLKAKGAKIDDAVPV